MAWDDWNIQMASHWLTVLSRCAHFVPIFFDIISFVSFISLIACWFNWLELKEKSVYQWVKRFCRNFFKSSRPDQKNNLKQRIMFKVSLHKCRELQPDTVPPNQRHRWTIRFIRKRMLQCCIKRRKPEDFRSCVVLPTADLTSAEFVCMSRSMPTLDALVLKPSGVFSLKNTTLMW